MSRLRILLAAICVCTGLAHTAGAATLSYEITARFDGDAPLELVRPDGTVCYDASCLPTGYRLPAELGGVWFDLAPGDVVKVRFYFPGFRRSSKPDKGFCLIAGFSHCGDLAEFDGYDSATGLVYADFFRILPTSSVVLDLARGRISYEGEAGSYVPTPCTEAAPVYAGLPSGYCDFFGYRAGFTVTGFESSLSAVPVPLSGFALVSGIGFLTVMRLARRKRQDRSRT
jgi:hypothetical protein